MFILFTAARPVPQTKDQIVISYALQDIQLLSQLLNSVCYSLKAAVEVCQQMRVTVF